MDNNIINTHSQFVISYNKLNTTLPTHYGQYVASIYHVTEIPSYSAHVQSLSIISL